MPVVGMMFRNLIGALRYRSNGAQRTPPTPVLPRMVLIARPQYWPNQPGAIVTARV
jgi:hypothetical protein